MELELIATLVQTGISLYQVYCEGCKENIIVDNTYVEKDILTYTCPDCGHKIEAKINR